MASSLSKSLTRTSRWKASSAPLTLLSVRASSTTTFAPESPLFVDVPQPKQRQSRNPPSVKGVLPRPRKIFRKHDAVSRDSDEYINSVNPSRRSARPVPFPQHERFASYKERMTELRRKNLRDGLQQLKARKDQYDIQVKIASREKQRNYQKSITKPEREEDRFTQPTIVEIQKDMTKVLMSAEEIEERRMRLADRNLTKAEERRVNLHTLYMNARDFIVTEDQLNKKVDEVFDDPYYRNSADPSIWGELGTPERVHDLLNKAQSRSDTALGSNEGYADRARERLHRLAEELTGGKMDEEGSKRFKPTT